MVKDTLYHNSQTISNITINLSKYMQYSKIRNGEK